MMALLQVDAAEMPPACRRHAAARYGLRNRAAGRGGLCHDGRRGTPAVGVNPVLGSTSEGLDNMLAAIATGPPSWTVVYESHAKILQLPDVAFLPTTPALSMATAVAVRADATSRTVAPLLRACAAAAGDDQFS
jgi:hypothetical protein